MNDSDITHKIWHKFDDWLTETFGGNYNSKLIDTMLNAKLKSMLKIILQLEYCIVVMTYLQALYLC